MVAEFTVVRGGVKNWIDMLLGATDRAININANAISVPNGVTYSIINLDGTSSILTGTGVVRALDIYLPTMRRAYAIYNTGGKIYSNIIIPSTFAGQYDIGGIISPGAVASAITIDAGAAPGGIISGLSTRITNNSTGVYGSVTSMICGLTNNASFAQTLTGLSSSVVDNGGADSVFGIINYVTVYRPINGGVGDCTGFSTSVVMDDRTGLPAVCNELTGIKSFISIDETSSAITARGIWVRCGHNAPTSVVNSYGIYIDTFLNGFLSNPLYIVHSKVIPAGTTWRGITLDAIGVTCAVGQTYYGLYLNMSTMTTGGTINGIRCIVPNLIPAMVLGDGVGTLTIDFGAGNHPNIDSSTGRVYFGTQAGGSAAADAIYCKNVYQTAPWAENTWDDIDDIGVLREINNAIFAKREPVLPEVFKAEYLSEGYYDRLQMDALERGAILKLADEVRVLKEENIRLKEYIGMKLGGVERGRLGPATHIPGPKGSSFCQ